MNVSFFSLTLYLMLLIIAGYITLYHVNLRTSYFVLQSNKKEAFVEREGLAWIVGTIIFAVSGAVRFLLEEMNWMTGVLNVISAGAWISAMCIWAWAGVRYWSRRHVPKSNMKTEKTGVP